MIFRKKLKIVLREDVQQSEEFKNIVIRLGDKLNEFNHWITHGFPISNETNLIISQKMESLENLIDLYINNKFSMPSTALTMTNNMVELRKYGYLLIDTIGKLEFVYKANENGINKDSFDDDELQQIVDDLENFSTNGDVLIREVVNMMIIRLKFIMNAILYDAIRVNVGVDIIRDYYKKQKQYKKTGFMRSQYNISFRTEGKTSKILKEKEMYKNDRDRRDANDGIQKTI